MRKFLIVASALIALAVVSSAQVIVKPPTSSGGGGGGGGGSVIQFPNNNGTMVGPFPAFPSLDSPSNMSTLSAAPSRFAGIGRLLLTSGAGTSKVISGAGQGKISWVTSGLTWANAGTTVRVGIQDVSGSLEDTVYDVFADLSPGTETVTASAVNTATMESGTKTITHGDLIAVVITMTARAGSDTMSMLRGGSLARQPYTSLNGGQVVSLPIITVTFDDGTVGYFGVSSFAYITEASPAFSSTSSPDEHALVFRLPFKAEAAGLYVQTPTVTGPTELILYSTPLGTPVAQRTIAFEGIGGRDFDMPFTVPFTLNANTDYAIAVRPTTGSGMVYYRMNFGTGNGILRKPTMLGTDWYLGTRTDQTGPFVANTTILPAFGVWIRGVTQ